MLGASWRIGFPRESRSTLQQVNASTGQFLGRSILGPVDANTTKLFRPIEQMSLARGSIVGVGLGVEHVIDGFSRQLAGTPLLSLSRPSAIFLHCKSEFDQAADRRGQGEACGLARCPLDD